MGAYEINVHPESPSERAPVSNESFRKIPNKDGFYVLDFEGSEAKLRIRFSECGRVYSSNIGDIDEIFTNVRELHRLNLSSSKFAVFPEYQVTGENGLIYNYEPLAFPSGKVNIKLTGLYYKNKEEVLKQSDRVVISPEYFNSLEQNSKLLKYLYEAGVMYWMGYDIALQNMKNREE